LVSLRVAQIDGPGPRSAKSVGVEFAQPAIMCPATGARVSGHEPGSGTRADVDPNRGLVSVLLTQRAMGGPDDGFDDFWQAVADD